MAGEVEEEGESIKEDRSVSESEVERFEVSAPEDIISFLGYSCKSGADFSSVDVL